MRNVRIYFIAAALFVSACNDAKRSESKNVQQHHGTENPMMKAMDDSMEAMHKAKQTGNADYDFASMMIPHHEGAIVMAEAIMAHGNSPELIEFSKKVIDVQRTEVETLKTFLKGANQTAAKNSEEFKKAINNSMKPMMKGMEEVKLTGNIDDDFVSLMIPHHQSAVDMAKAYLPFSENAQLKKMAAAIIQSQEEEIKWLKAQR